MSTRRSPTFPAGSWPPRMNAEMAAGYCGEKHVEDFLERVGSVYPLPRVVDSTRRKFWYRDDLDRAMKLHVVEVSSGIGARFRDKIREKRNSSAA